jgi:hypothetical protein
VGKQSLVEHLDRPTIVRDAKSGRTGSGGHFSVPGIP